MATHSSILAWKFNAQRSVARYSPWGHRVRHDWACITCSFYNSLSMSPIIQIVCMHAKSLQLCPTLYDLWTGAHQGPLSLGFSSILAWEVSSTEKPGRLSSMGSQRVGHGWMTKPSPPLTEIVERTSVIPELWSCVTPLFLMSVWYTLAGLEHGQETLSTLLI